MLAHYRILEPMGEGAMGRVYRAEDTGLDRPVAVKVLRSEVAEDAAIVDRFAREARAAARVSHENLTHVYFVGSQGDLRFFAMELVPGEDLEALVRREGPQDLDRSIAILLQVARALSAAHRAGVMHRDVKPSNIIRRPDGTVKITDFGLSKSLDGDVEATKGGQILGTPTYMSPEQCRGEAVDERTDVYALGLVGWFLLGGGAPFPGPGIGTVINDQINARLPRLAARRPDLPAGVQEALDRMCEKDPARRPASMDEVVRLLEPLRPREIEAAPLATRATAALADLLLALVVAGALAFAIDKVGLPVGGTIWDVYLFLSVFALLVLGGELAFQRSPGKWLFQLGVVRPDGNRARPDRLALRFLLRYPYVPLAALLWASPPARLLALGAQAAAVLLGVLVYYARRGRTFSDVVTRTRVAYLLPRRMEEGEPPAPDPTRWRP
jgi:serine/threonine-protein kinase